MTFGGDFHPHPNPLPSREGGYCCHCEECCDAAIPVILSLSKDANEIAALRSQ